MTHEPSTRFFVFDLDGTLVDSAPDIARALNATLGAAGFPQLPLSKVLSYVGDGAAALIERAVPRDVAGDVAALAPLVEQFKRRYADAICVDSRPYPGVLETLHLLVSRGVRLAVLTNKPSALARALLHVLGFDRLISDVVGDGDGFPRKPATDGARALISRSGIGEDHTWIIGDGLPDIRLGAAVGCGVAAVSWGYTPRALLAAERPDRVLDSPEELITLLERPTLLP